MSDDLEDLLRRAMQTLDDQVPPGYFEDFPRRTLARLEDPSMQGVPGSEGMAGMAGTAGRADAPLDAIHASSAVDSIPPLAEETAEPPPPVVAEAAPAEAPAPAPAQRREDDSGLHDLRSLASSQRMRLSARGKRGSQNPIPTDDDLLASSSSSWRAVALPEPAKMVSLPEPSELSPAHEVKEGKKESKIERKAAAARESAPKLAAAAASTAAAGEPGEAAAAVEQPGVTPITAAKAKPKAPPAAGQRTGARTALIAAAGLAVAAAAGVVIFMSTKDSATDAPMVQSASKRGAGTVLPELRQVAPAAATAADTAPAMGSAAAAAEPRPLEVPADRSKVPALEKPTKSIGKYVPNVDEGTGGKPTRKDEPKKKPEPGDPDFEKLLKESGYQEKSAEKPRLEKKSLSGDDIKLGMNAVAAKVQACYAGQQGTAAVKLTVAPTGQIQKVTVSGVFAGTPVGACVEGAVQLVTFPPWDGGPQTVSYSYLLAE
jgi:hypothetical protein